MAEASGGAESEEDPLWDAAARRDLLACPTGKLSVSVMVPPLAHATTTTSASPIAARASWTKIAFFSTALTPCAAYAAWRSMLCAWHGVG